MSKDRQEHSVNLVRAVLADPVHWLAFGLGAGLLPRAPGTWGSLLTVLVFWSVAPVEPVVLWSVIGVLGIGGIWICGESARRLGVHDHGGIVLDEVVGMLIALAFVGHEPLWLAVAFVAFRIADIWKPWPIRELDHRLRGGLGIMLDDVLAGFLAALAVALLQRI